MAQGPEVSRHGRDWSFWNSSLGLWSALGRKLQDNPVLPSEVSGETFLVVVFFFSHPFSRRFPSCHARLFPTLLRMV